MLRLLTEVARAPARLARAPAGLADGDVEHRRRGRRSGRRCRCLGLDTGRASPEHRQTNEGDRSNPERHDDLDSRPPGLEKRQHREHTTDDDLGESKAPVPKEAERAGGTFRDQGRQHDQRGPRKQERGIRRRRVDPNSDHGRARNVGDDLVDPKRDAAVRGSHATEDTGRLSDTAVRELP